MTDTLFDTVDYTIDELADPELSTGRRRTIRARIALDSGRHPANGEPVDLDHRCGDCGNLERHGRGGSKTFFKCGFHRLGKSHSEASDLRACWPACPHFTADT